MPSDVPDVNRIGRLGEFFKCRFPFGAILSTNLIDLFPITTGFTTFFLERKGGSFNYPARPIQYHPFYVERVGLGWNDGDCFFAYKQLCAIKKNLEFGFVFWID